MLTKYTCRFCQGEWGFSHKRSLSRRQHLVHAMTQFMSECHDISGPTLEIEQYVRMHGRYRRVRKGSWRLAGATLVVTLEPCPMCAGAAWAARLDRVVWGAPNPDAGALGSLYHLGADPRLNHEFEVSHGVRAEECASLLADFFADRR